MEENRRQDSVHRARSLPQMDFLKVQSDQDDDLMGGQDLYSTLEVGPSSPGSALSVRTQGPTSPLQPALLPTFKRSQNQSQYWFSSPKGNGPEHSLSGLHDEVLGVPQPQFSVLHAAAITGDKSRLQKLIIGEFCDINDRDKFERTPLMFAVLGDYPECVEVLLKYGADPHLKDRSGRTALHWAAHHGHFGCVKIILSKTDEGWSETDQGGVTILHLATRHPLKRGLHTLFKHFTIGPGEIDLQDRNKRSPLHWACSLGHHECVRLLLKNGSQQGLIDVEGKTPLHWAASSGGLANMAKNFNNKEYDPVKCVQLLLDASTQVLNWQDYEGRIALHLAVADSDDELVEVFLENERTQINALDNNSRCPLHWAAMLGKHHIVYSLLDHGARYRCQDVHGATPLHYAVSAEQTDTVEALMRRPEILDYPDLSGRTALMWAAAKGSHPTLIQAMCRHGADLAHRDTQGLTALHTAVVEQKEQAVQTLLKMGGNVHLVTKEDQTALDLAAQHGWTKIAGMLLEAGSDIDRVDHRGRHALHWAGQGGHGDVVDMLFHIHPSLNPNVMDEYGRTPLTLASFGGYIGCMQALLKMGANTNLRDNEGMCGLHWASLRGHLDAVRLLLASGAFPNHIATRRRGHRIEDGSAPLDESKKRVCFQPRSTSGLGMSSKSVKAEKLLTQPQADSRADDEVPFTPLDSAIMGEFKEIVECLLAHEGLTLCRIQNIAATRLQAFFRGARIRRSFNSHKSLLLKHERLRAEKRVRRSRPEHSRSSEPLTSERRDGARGCPTDCHSNDNRGNHHQADKRYEHDERMSDQESKLLEIGGTFLGHVVEVTSNSAFARRVPRDPTLPASTHQTGLGDGRKAQSHGTRDSSNPMKMTYQPVESKVHPVDESPNSEQSRKPSLRKSKSVQSPIATRAKSNSGGSSSSMSTSPALKDLSLSSVRGRKIDWKPTRRNSIDGSGRFGQRKSDQKYSYNMN